MPNFNFAQSDYDLTQFRYEEDCRNAKASNQDKRAATRKSIEDELVQSGLTAIVQYELELAVKREKANCLAEYDGINMGLEIVKRARARITDS